MAHKRPNNCEQVSTSTGYNDMVVSGAQSYRQTFAQALADGDTVEAIITEADGTIYEHGIYEWDEPTLSLKRGGFQIVLESSNHGMYADLPVAFAAGTKKVIACMAGRSHHLAVKHVFDSSETPDNADNAAQGYSVGSMMLRALTGGIMYVLAYFSGANAQWNQVLTFLATSGTPSVRARTAYRDRTNALYVYTGMQGNSLADEDDTFSGEYLYSDWAVGGLGALTIDATPTKMGYNGNWALYYGLYIEGRGASVIKGTLVALEKDSNNSLATWDCLCVASADDLGAVTIHVNTVTSLFDNGTLDAAAASATFVVGDDYDITLEVTGVAAKNIIWSFVPLVTTTAAY